MTIYRFKTKPYVHQVKALKRALKRHHIGLLWEPGTGKTKAIVDWTCALFLAGKADRALVICPLSVTGVWEEEYETHAPIPYRLVTLDKKDESLDWGRSPERVLSVLVVNYDLAWRRKELIDAFNADIVVADESHRIKKPSTRRSRFLRTRSRARYRAILTGTPTPKSYLDLYGQWVFLNPRRFGTNFAAFKRKYIVFGGFMDKKVKGYQNVDDLKTRVRSDATIRRKDQCLDLPDRTYQRIPIVLEESARRIYEKMAYELFLELENGEISDAKNVAVKLLRLQQITGGWIKSDEGNLHRISTAKMIACEERLEDLWNNDERVVVFARFRPEVSAIAELGLQGGVKTYVLGGNTRREDRDDFRRSFQAKRGPSLFVAQIQTGGLGITLHSSAEVLFYSVTYALDDYIQACDRVHRIGQTRNVRYQHLVGVNTVDVDIYRSLREKGDILKTIMGTPEILTRGLKNGKIGGD
jgi:SNF2 family DNA or RNA helicase